MTRPVEIFDSPAAFLVAQRRQTRHAPAGTPRAGRAAATGLSTFLAAGWNWEYRAGAGYQLTAPDGRATSWCVSELAACQEARTL